MIPNAIFIPPPLFLFMQIQVVRMHGEVRVIGWLAFVRYRVAQKLAKHASQENISVKKKEKMRHINVLKVF